MFGLEHLFLNCHGELSAVAGMLVGLPVVGVYVKAWLARRRKKCCERT